jgi:AcrR family transcriptional regulator
MESSTNVKPVRSKKIEQGDATREALVAAARGLFGAQGEAAVSRDEIVRSAGVTKGALYHHFSGKQQLFHAVFKMVKRELRKPHAWHQSDGTEVPRFAMRHASDFPHSGTCAS